MAGWKRDRRYCRHRRWVCRGRCSIRCVVVKRVKRCVWESAAKVSRRSYCALARSCPAKWFSWPTRGLYGAWTRFDRESTNMPPRWGFTRTASKAPCPFNSRRVSRPVHQLDFECGQLFVVVVNGFGRGGDGGIVVHQRDQGAVSGGVVQRHHGADAAGRAEAGIAIRLMELLHHDDAVAQLAQKHLVGIRRDQRGIHPQAVRAQLDQHCFQRFEFGA